jgi:putative ATP-dependent endonuclease of OLD family
MKLREVKIKNFRNLVDISVPVDDTTVLVGENNSGKTAFLDALRIALTRSSSSKVSLFDEYDYHMATIGDSPQTSEGIAIEL